MVKCFSFFLDRNTCSMDQALNVDRFRSSAGYIIDCKMSPRPSCLELANLDVDAHLHPLQTPDSNTNDNRSVRRKDGDSSRVCQVLYYALLPLLITS
jgi:hypothetical protein